MEDRIICRKGKCVDLESVDCGNEFDDYEDVRYCEIRQEEFVSRYG